MAAYANLYAATTHLTKTLWPHILIYIQPQLFLVTHDK